MTIHRTALLALLLPLLAATCMTQPSEEPDAAAEGAPGVSDAAAVAAFLPAWDAAINAGDVQAVLDLYAGEAACMPPHEPGRAGTEARRGWGEAVFADGPVEVSNRAVETRIAGDWAFLHGTFTLSRTPAAGGEPVRDAGRWVAVLKRETDGSWKLARNIWNSENPMPGLPPPGEPSPAPADEPAEAFCASTPEELDRHFATALVAGDAAVLMSSHTEQAVRIPPGRPVQEGRAAVGSFIQTVIDRYEPRSLSLEPGGSYVSGDWAASWGSYAFDYRPKAGGAPFVDNGKYVSVDRRGPDGCWRHEWVIWNSDRPRPEPGA